MEKNHKLGQAADASQSNHYAMAKEKTGMTGQQCMEVIEQFAQQQGFYKRMSDRLKELECDAPDDFERFLQLLEAESFQDPVDLIMYFET